MKKDMIYVSGAMSLFFSDIPTKDEIAFVKQKFERTKKILVAFGYDADKIILPTDFCNTDNINERSYGDYIGEDIRIIIDKCKTIIFQHDWLFSKGARIEMETAKQFNINIIDESEFDLFVNSSIIKCLLMEKQ